MKYPHINLTVLVDYNNNNNNNNKKYETSKYWYTYEYKSDFSII